MPRSKKKNARTSRFGLLSWILAIAVIVETFALVAMVLRSPEPRGAYFDVLEKDAGRETDSELEKEIRDLELRLEERDRELEMKESELQDLRLRALIQYEQRSE